MEASEFITALKGAEGRGRPVGSQFVTDFTAMIADQKFVTRTFDTPEDGSRFMANFYRQKQRITGVTALRRGKQVFIINWGNLAEDERAEVSQSLVVSG